MLRWRYIDLMDRFAKILKELREEKDLTQTQLGIELGFKGHSVIAQWESGKRFPEIENLITISKFFGVRIDYLVGLED